MLFRSHYRSPINYSRDLLLQAQSSLERLYTARDNAIFAREHAHEKPLQEDEIAFKQRSEEAIRAFDTAMDDDLNTADAIGAIFDYIRDMNTILADSRDPSLATYNTALNTLRCMTDVLGLLRREADGVPEEIKQLVAQRTQAKKDKNFALADGLRAKVLEMGYVIEDTPKGAKVKKA